MWQLMLFQMLHKSKLRCLPQLQLWWPCDSCVGLALNSWALLRAQMSMVLSFHELMSMAEHGLIRSFTSSWIQGKQMSIRSTLISSWNKTQMTVSFNLTNWRIRLELRPCHFQAQRSISIFKLTTKATGSRFQQTHSWIRHSESRQLQKEEQ